VRTANSTNSTGRARGSTALDGLSNKTWYSSTVQIAVVLVLVVMVVLEVAMVKMIAVMVVVLLVVIVLAGDRTQQLYVLLSKRAPRKTDQPTRMHAVQGQSKTDAPGFGTHFV
jgi:hypothetical protein